MPQAKLKETEAPSIDPVELEMLLQKAGREMGESDAVGHYAFVFDKGEPYVERHGGCHAGVLGKYWKRVAEGRQLVAILTRVNREDAIKSRWGRQLIGDEAIAYLDYLLNRSPYSGVFLTKDAERAYKQKWVAIDVTKPGNWVQSACIATRNMFEFPDNLRTGMELASRGIPERLAHILGLVMVKRTEKEYALSKNYGGHYLIGRDVTREGMKAFHQGIPMVENGAYCDPSADAHGVEIQWSRGNTNLLSFLENFCKDLEVKGENLNPFLKSKPSPVNSSVLFDVDKFCEGVMVDLDGFLGK